MLTVIKHNPIVVDEEKRRISLIKGSNYTRQKLNKPLISDFSEMSNDDILADNLLLSFEFEDIENENDEDI